MKIQMSEQMRSVLDGAHQRVWRWPAWKRQLEQCPEPQCERAIGHLVEGIPHGFSSFVEWSEHGAPPPKDVELTTKTDDATTIRFSLLELK